MAGFCKMQGLGFVCFQSPVLCQVMCATDKQNGPSSRHIWGFWVKNIGLKVLEF